MGRKRLEGTYYSRHKERACKMAISWYHKNKEMINAKKREKRRNDPHFVEPRATRPYGIKIDFKDAILSHYGRLCACCSESNSRLLTIDHKNDNGKEHGTKKCRYKGIALYRFLVAIHFPDGLQVLCFNCNIGRRNNKGVCPHKSQRL